MGRESVRFFWGNEGTPIYRLLQCLDRSQLVTILKHTTCPTKLVDRFSKESGLRFTFSNNSVISVKDIPRVVCRLPRVPHAEPTGCVSFFRERGLSSGVYGLVQDFEDVLWQRAAIRSSIQRYQHTGHYGLKVLGTLADDVCQTDTCEDEDLWVRTTKESFMLYDFEIDWTRYWNSNDSEVPLHVLGYDITPAGASLPTNQLIAGLLVDEQSRPVVDKEDEVGLEISRSWNVLEDIVKWQLLQMANLPKHVML